MMGGGLKHRGLPDKQTSLQTMGSLKNLNASRRGGFNSSVINLPDGVYLPAENKIKLMNIHNLKMNEIE